MVVDMATNGRRMYGFSHKIIEKTQPKQVARPQIRTILDGKTFSGKILTNFSAQQSLSHNVIKK